MKKTRVQKSRATVPLRHKLGDQADEKNRIPLSPVGWVKMSCTPLDFPSQVAGGSNMATLSKIEDGGGTGLMMLL